MADAHRCVLRDHILANRVPSNRRPSEPSRVAGQSLIASTSMLIFTSSLIAGTKVLIPNSLRLTVAVALPPQVGFLLIGLTAQLKLVTVKLTGLVTPCSVRSPSAPARLLPLYFSFVDLKVIVGYLATSKKSGLRKCSSRFACPVVTVVTSTVASMLPALPEGSSTILPLVALNVPRMLEKPRWLISKPGKVCAGSMV